MHREGGCIHEPTKQYFIIQEKYFIFHSYTKEIVIFGLHYKTIVTYFV